MSSWHGRNVTGAARVGRDSDEHHRYWSENFVLPEEEGAKVRFKAWSSSSRFPRTIGEFCKKSSEVNRN